MRIQEFARAEDFIRHAGPWLAEREPEYNLLLGLFPRLLAGGYGTPEPLYLATVESSRGIAGCIFRTPPHKLTFGSLPLEILPGLTERVATIYAHLPAVTGPEGEASRFAEEWCRLRGVRSSRGMALLIHALERVVFPPRPPGGSLRIATFGDLPLVKVWVEAFMEETGHGNQRNPDQAAELIGKGTLHLWQDGSFRSMVAAPAMTPTGARIGYVYTPPAHRACGYAGMAVATFSERLLAEGRKACYLYTDLANPTANALYARIGYRPIGDVVDIHFAA